METAPQAPGNTYLVGLLMIAASLFIYLIRLFLPYTPGTQFFFFFNYLITVVYFIMLCAEKRWRNPFIFLTLFFISAWSLNLDICVFQPSVPWLSITLVIFCVNCLLLPFVSKAPMPVQRLSCILLGGSLVLFLYFSFYIWPIALFGLFGFFFLGISLHALLPFLFFYYTLKEALKLNRANRSNGWSVLAGVTVSILIPVMFTLQWYSVGNTVDKDLNKSLIADNNDLPGWVKVARTLPDSWVTEKYLKEDVVYTVPKNLLFNFNWSFTNKNFTGGRKHDPLVTIASLFTETPDMTPYDRIKILEAIYVSRHETQDRLWTGADLRTTNIISNIKIWPQQRIAYTEKTITVHNRGGINGGWWEPEEAIYSFYLPEGGIVTSLSLWIDGKEQKGVLTTTGKADSAYKQIVGGEPMHDPSLVRWQEGNTVSVRVFPVKQGESRIFKIGITAPLTDNGSKLVYENIPFEGPGLSGADETQQIDWADEPKDIVMPPGFTRNKNHRYIRDARYDPDWRLEFNDPGFRPETFTFDGNSYGVQPYTKQYAATVFKDVYLDVNSAWTQQDLEQVYSIVKDHNVFVFNESLLPISQEDLKKNDFINALLQQRFSLFPFYEIEDPATALVITKNTGQSPNLRDLNGNGFAKKLETKMQNCTPIKLFNLGAKLTPYLKSLKEHRLFLYEQGDLALLQQLLHSNTFVRSIEDDNHVVVDNAAILLTKSAVAVSDTSATKMGMALIKSADTGKDAAQGPDHLMRLFAYNHLMSKLKKKLFSNAETDSVLVREAEQAYIVSPLSSLIVLETQVDYDRFKITKGNNTLDDATLRSKGAVPEPHEWALIVMACLVMAWVIFRGKTKIAGV